MHDRPTIDELLRAVELLLDEELVPSLDGARKYNARVAANVVRIVRRELAREEAQLDAEWRSLDGLLGAAKRPQSRAALRDALRERNAQLAERIRAGDADEDVNASFRTLAITHVRESVRAKLEVSDPEWLTDGG